MYGYSSWFKKSNVKQNGRSILKHIYTSSKKARYVLKLNYWLKDAYSNHPEIMMCIKVQKLNFTG